MNSTSFSFCICSRSLRVSPLITVHHTERNAGVSSKAGFSSIFKKNSAEAQQDAIALMLTEYGMNEASLQEKKYREEGTERLEDPEAANLLAAGNIHGLAQKWQNTVPKAENDKLQEGPGKKKEENLKNDQEEMVLKKAVSLRRIYDIDFVENPGAAVGNLPHIVQNQRITDQLLPGLKDGHKVFF